MSQMKKDLKFMQVARTISTFSKCSSRQVGAVLVQDGAIVGQGYNGAPRGIELCQDGPDGVCPRQKAGYGSGEGLHLCPAVHAEANVIAQAGRNGVCTKSGTVYIYASVRPCRVCMGQLINAGIRRIVVLQNAVAYDDLAERLLAESSITVGQVQEELLDLPMV